MLEYNPNYLITRFNFIAEEIISNIDINILKNEIENLIEKSILSDFGPFYYLNLPDNINYRDLIQMYNDIDLFFSKKGYSYYWTIINITIRDKQFSEYIIDKINNSIPNVIICGHYHVKGIKKHLNKYSNIEALNVDDKHILKLLDKLIIL